jgi:hypothetical protein
MSDGHDHEHDDAADAHDHHDFDGEPAKELGPDEPHTPGWVPLVGAALFVAGAVFLVTQREPTPAGASGAKEGAAAAPQTAAAAPQPRPAPQPRAVPPPRPAAGAPGQPQPGATGLPNVKKLTPDQVQDLQKRINEAKQKQEAGGAK